MGNQELQKHKHLDTPLTVDDVAGLRAGDLVLITGELITARDAAHKRLAHLIEQGKALPFDPEGQIIYYFGPAPTRPESVIGPGAPTTAERMDAYAPALMARGIKGMIGKGNRGPEVRSAIKKHRCVYFAAVAGASVILSKRIVSTETICYEDLQTESVRRLRVSEFPAIVVNDMYGADLYETARLLYASR